MWRDKRPSCPRIHTSINVASQGRSLPKDCFTFWAGAMARRPRPSRRRTARMFSCPFTGKFFSPVERQLDDDEVWAAMKSTQEVRCCPFPGCALGCLQALLRLRGPAALLPSDALCCGAFAGHQRHLRCLYGRGAADAAPPQRGSGAAAPERLGHDGLAQRDHLIHPHHRGA